MRKFPTIIMMILLSVSLIGCSSEPSAKTDDSKTAAHSAKPEKQGLLEVYPEAGHKRGVVQSGKSVEFSYDNKGLTYRCKPGFKSLRLPYLGSISYNGTVIKYDSDDLKKHDKKSKLITYDQFGISLTFDGEQDSFSQKAISLIVHTGGMKFSSGSYENVDEYVVNLTPEMIERGIELRNVDFGFVEKIYDVDFCLRK